MRGLACILVLASTAAPSRAAATGGTVAVWWQPAGEVAPAARLRAAFAEAAARRGAPVVDAVATARRERPLAPMLAAALADYAAFRFADALAELDELARVADARGGGELDARQLSEIYLYRALARLEVGPAEAAWDDLVRAARLDLVVPDGAAVRLDGRPLSGVASVAVGAHLVAVSAAGYEPWAGVVTVTGARERLQPPLRRDEPPDADGLLALTRERAPARILLGAVVRGDGGWRFVARTLTVADGKTVSGSAALDAAPAATTVERVIAGLSPIEPVAPAATDKPPLRKRWWVWAVAGGVAATLAVVIPVSIVYGTSSPGQIGGPVPH